MSVSKATRKRVIFLVFVALILGFYRFRWGILGLVNIGPPSQACENIEVLNTYLSTGGSPSAYLRRTPLIACAARAGSYDVVSELINRGADVNAQITNIPLPIMFEDIGSTALYVSILEGHTEIAKLLFENGAFADLSGAAGSPLNLAIRLNQSQLLELFLESDNVIYELDEGRIFRAAHDGNLEIFKILFEADVRLEDFRFEEVYEAALTTAASKGHIEIVKFLFDKGISIDEGKISTGLNGLHQSARFAYIDVVNFLISAGADVNSIDNEGNTPLHYSAMANRLEIAKILIESGADVSIENAKGKTPLEVSIENDSLEVMSLLENLGDPI